jgi:hypothetical protein
MYSTAFGGANRTKGIMCCRGLLGVSHRLCLRVSHRLRLLAPQPYNNIGLAHALISGLHTRSLGDGKSSLGDAKSSLGGAKS